VIQLECVNWCKVESLLTQIYGGDRSNLGPSKLATSVEASHQLGVSQYAWDLVLRRYILGIVQQ
jgi:hypothetical protein